MPKEQQGLSPYNHRHVLVSIVFTVVLITSLAACAPGGAQKSAPTGTVKHVNLVVYTNGNVVTALRASDGALLWHYHMSVPIADAVKIADGVVYVIVKDAPSTVSVEESTYSLYALRTSDGRLLWHYKTDSNVPWFWTTTDGLVLVYARKVSGTLDAEKSTHALYALQASTGTLLWHHQTDGTVWLVATNGVIYISTAAFTDTGTTGSLYALRERDGSVLWNSPIGHHFFWPPNLIDGVIYASTFDENTSTKEITSSLYELRASDGTLLRQFQLGPGTFPQVTKGAFYLIATSPPAGTSQRSISVYAQRTSDGAILWHSPLKLDSTFDGVPSLMVTHDVVYVSTNFPGHVYALRASDGTQLWHYRANHDGEAKQLRAENGRVYIANEFFSPLSSEEDTHDTFADNKARTTSLEVRKASDGSLIWQYPNASQRGVLSYELANGVVYVGASSNYQQRDDQYHSGSVCALRAETGTKLWCYKTNTGVSWLALGA